MCRVDRNVKVLKVEITQCKDTHQGGKNQLAQGHEKALCV